MQLSSSISCDGGLGGCWEGTIVAIEADLALLLLNLSKALNYPLQCETCLF